MNHKNNFPLGAGFVSLTIREKLGYGMGDFASNISFTLVTLFILSFYTDVYGLTVEQASLILFVARLLDAIFNLVIGQLIDRTHTRHGKLRPYVLYGSLPLGVMTVLCFTVFDSDHKFAIALITYVLFCFCYTLVNTPYSALTTRMTQEPQSRASLAIYRFVLAFAAYSIMAITVGPAVSAFEATSAGYFYVVLIGAVAATVCFWICFRETRERVEDGETEHYGFLSAIKMISRNRPLLVLSWCAAFLYLGSGIWMTVAVYYVRYSMGGDNYLSAFFLVQSVAYVLGTLGSGYLIRRFGKKLVAEAMLLISAFSLVAQYVVPGNYLIFDFLSVFLFSFGSSAVMVVIWAMIADTVEYGEWQEGQRSEGLIYCFFNFITKVAMAAAGGIVGWLLSHAGYDAAAVTPTAVDGIKLIITLVPAAMMVLCVVGIRVYSIDEARFCELVEAIAAKKTKTSDITEQQYDSVS